MLCEIKFDFFLFCIFVSNITYTYTHIHYTNEKKIKKIDQTGLYIVYVYSI